MTFFFYQLSPSPATPIEMCGLQGKLLKTKADLVKIYESVFSAILCVCGGCIRILIDLNFAIIKRIEEDINMKSKETNG